MRDVKIDLAGEVEGLDVETEETEEYPDYEYNNVETEVTGAAGSCQRKLFACLAGLVRHHTPADLARFVSRLVLH